MGSRGGFQGNLFPDAYSGMNAPDPNHHFFRQTGFAPGTRLPGSANEPPQSRPGKDVASALWTTCCMQHQVKPSAEIKPAFHIIKIIPFGNTNTHASSALPVLFGIKVTGVHCGLSVAGPAHGGFTPNIRRHAHCPSLFNGPVRPVSPSAGAVREISGFSPCSSGY